MTAIGITRNQRVASRVLFYLGVVITMWVMNALSPRPADAQLSDEAVGAAKVYIASPVVPESASSQPAP